MITLRRAELSDAAEAIALLRDTDPHHRSVGELREEIIATPEPWLIAWDGRPAALFGLIPVDRREKTATCWLITTAVAREGGVAFARESRRIWPALTKGWRRVDGYAPSLSRSATLWLMSLGFRIESDADGARFTWTQKTGDA